MEGWGSLRITLEAARVNAHLTQIEASERLGISRSTLQSYERGDTVPTWEMVEKISSTYGFPMALISFGK